MNPANLAAIIRARADEPFLIDSVRGITHTYAGFHRGACELADVLRAGGIGRGDRVIIFAPNSAEFVAAYFACLYLGATAVPINPQLHDNDVRFILDRCTSSGILYSAKTVSRCESDLARARFTLCLGAPGEGNVSPQAWSLRENIPARDTDWQCFEQMQPDQLFSITFTSGTTGLPKGVAHTAGNLLGSAAAFNQALGFDERMRMYHVFNMAYMAGFLNTLLCPFLAGGSVVIGPAFDVSMAMKFWDVPIKHGVNTLWLVPTILKILLKMDRGERGRAYCREHIKTICAGTAQLQSRVKDEFEKAYGVAVHESYGLSELLFITSNSARVPFQPGSAGCLLDGVEIRIGDGAGKWLPAGETGEVLVKTPHCMAGYLNLERGVPDPATAPEWFPTGRRLFVHHGSQEGSDYPGRTEHQPESRGGRH
jgi:acyl-coenzyme A synthetase/AMP-(fatty) acid ligase